MKFLKYLCFVMVLMLTAPFAVAACEDGKTIKLAGLDWESGQFTTAVLNTILQDGYGCQTSTVPGTGTALETALVQNDIQVIAEQWIGRSPVMQKAIDEHKAVVIGDTLKGGATQGWYVPDYVKQEYSDLNSIDDLKKFAYLFPNPEALQQARFLNCPSGWTCEIANSRLLDNTGLGEVFDNVRPGTGAALDAEITSAYEQKRPILFYYWQPTGLMAKYRFEPLEFPEHNAACWATILDANSQNRCVSGYPVSKLAVAVSTPFLEAHPDLVEMIKRLQFEPDMLNRAILEMSENQRSGEEQAQLFLKQNPHVWQQWVSEEAAVRLSEALGVAAPESSGIFRTWSISDGLNKSLKNTVQKHGEQLRSAGEVTLRILLPLERLLQTVPAWLVILVVGAIGLHATHKWWFALLCMFGFYTIGSFGLWEALMQTIALLMASVLLTMIIGIPVGIFTAYRKRLYQWLSPVLDVMQTMPSFVYLIPVLMLFGIGKVPALFATVVYALAPLIRLTALGIRQVSPQMIEAAIAFGSNRWQLLKWVLLPQAKPSIMAGINQAVMMSLGMVVLASMIGARGLGEYVLQAVQTLNIGQGVEAGAAIVILAIIIDRITQAYGSREKGSRHE